MRFAFLGRSKEKMFKSEVLLAPTRTRERHNCDVRSYLSLAKAKSPDHPINIRVESAVSDEFCLSAHLASSSDLTAEIVLTPTDSWR